MIEGLIVAGILGIVLALFISLMRGRRRKLSVVNAHQQEPPMQAQDIQPRTRPPDDFSVQNRPERRSGGDRRCGDDRREAVRFSEDRRTNVGRRKEDQVWAGKSFPDKK